MSEGGLIASLRRNLVGPTSRLIAFLRMLATKRYTPIRDVDDHLSVSWLTDLPPTISLMQGAGPGEILLAIEPVTAEPHPEIPGVLHGWVDPMEAAASLATEPSLRTSDGNATAETPAEVANAFAVWIRAWTSWAAEDRRTANHRRWYSTLVDAYQKLDQHSDEVELVVAAGLLGWAPPSGAIVRTHLLATRAKITVDVETGRLELLVDPDATTRLADRELLDGEAGFDSARAEPIRQRLRGRVPITLEDETRDVMERWRTLALDRCRPYEHDNWARIDEVDGIPQIRFAPAVVLRKRDTASLLGYYDQMLDVLSGPHAEAPLGLAQLLVPLESEQRLAWLEADGTVTRAIEKNALFPLPSNDEQRQAIERLSADNGVVVLGPPGTGKSQSIANLISALLAQGHRVLVTSQKAQALRVLADKLPPEISDLCVSMTDLARGGSAELNRSVSALSERYGSHDPVAQENLVTQLTTRRESELARVATVKERIRSIREAETYQHPEIAPGYQGTLGAISSTIRARERTAGWVPIPLPTDAAPASPLSVTELGQLRRLLSDITPERRARPTQELPELSALPSGTTVRGWFAVEAAAAQAAQAMSTALSQGLAACAPAILEQVAQAISTARNDLDALGVSSASPSAPDWRARVLLDGFARRDTTVLEQLTALSAQAIAARDNLEMVGLREIRLPVPVDGEGIGAHIARGRALRTYLAGGSKLRRFRPSPVQRAAERFLAESSVDGIPPTTPELIDLVLAFADAQSIAAALAGQWAMVGMNVETSDPLLRRVGRLVDAATELAAIRRVLAARDDVVQVLGSARTPLSLGTFEQWKALEAALTAVALQREADYAAAQVAEQTAALDLKGRARAAPPELSAATRALASRDADAYDAALAALARAHIDQQEQQLCDALLLRLHRAHPGLSQLLERTAADPAWDARIATFADAWAWAKARTFFDDQRQPGLDERLNIEFEDAVARLEMATGHLAAAQAWGHALRRMNASQAQALQVYRQAMSDRGAGKGRYAYKFEKAAREAMVAARGAVPAWIMPLAEVLETVPPDRNSFDVVIVDEASQASIESLFLLWLAPRVIVVGDDRQCTPSQVSHGELQPIFDALDEYLPDVPAYLRVAFTPRSSLFSILATRFGSVIRLREHFRCMPEIIGWSSRQFYADSPLIPLRQFGAERLHPLLCTHIPAAYAEGVSTRMRNPVEATAIADAVAACMKDPAYDGKTFGVIALQGTGQISLLQDLLLTRMPTEAWEQRRLRVGSPPDFQGDERDVIFLSMVVAEPPRAVTMLDWQRRYNVAASRARDQLWLFHSVTLDSLSPVDLRRSLLSYVMHPPAPDAVGGLDDVRDDVPHPRFDSLFEQRVFNRIRRRGYHVVPQFEVNGRRIDLVVLGAHGRLAVECDGPYHDTAEQRDSDLHRELGLKRAQWKFWRIRLSEFEFAPEAAMESLWSTLESRGIRPHDLNPEAAEAQGDDWNPLAPVMIEGVDDPDDEVLDVGSAALDPIRHGIHSGGHRSATPPSLGSGGAMASALRPQVQPSPVPPPTDKSMPTPVPDSRALDPEVGVEAERQMSSPEDVDGGVPNHVHPYATWPMHALPPVFPTDRETIAKGLVEIAKVEGPLVCERLFQLYVKSCGGQRVRSLIRERLRPRPVKWCMSRARHPHDV